MILNVKELRDMFKIEIDKDDHVLNHWLLAAQEEAESICDTVLEAADITEYHDGLGDSLIQTRNIPLNSVAKLYDDPARVFGSNTEIATSDFVFRPSGEVTLIYLRFTIWKQNVKIVYNAGYAQIPYDLKKAVANLAFASYLEANGGVNAIQAQDFIYKPKKLRDEAEGILYGYRKIC